MKKHKHILAAIDLHDNYKEILNYAKKTAQKHSTKLTAIHVSPNILSSMPYAYDFQAQIEKDVKQDLSKLEKEFDYPGFSTVLAFGSPKDEISKYAEENNVDMIITGSHGKSGIELVLGSTANGILHRAKCDVLTLRVNNEGKLIGKTPHKNILLATDLHEDNKLVIEAAEDIAKNSNGTVFAIHTVTELPAMYNVHIPSAGIDLKNNAKFAMQELAKKIGLKEENTRVIVGHPKSEILDYADEISADLIVIGSHCRSGLVSAFLGSTANAILHGSKTDVYVVRI
jgi:universal stress protein A